jgi:NADPH:quinone reductase-like Zn-dependent oxidoreductase
VATASPHNADYLKSLGAEAVFDYKSPTAGADIRAYTNNSLKLAWDCTGLGAPVISAAFGSEGGRYASIMPVNMSEAELKQVNPNIDGPHVTLMYSIFGEEFQKRGDPVPPKPEEHEFAQKFWELSRELLESGKLKTVKPIVNRGGSGLDGIFTGLDELRGNKVSGGKLVYTL